MPPTYLFDLDRLGASRLLLLTFLGIGLLAGFLFWIGLVGWVLRGVSVLIRAGVRAGFRVWRLLLSWAAWPVLLGLVAVTLTVGVWGERLVPGLAIVCGAGLLLIGVATCLAYVFIDLERYEVARGYKAIHEPLQGQELASNLVRYGSQVGLPLLASAAVGVIVGFALLNQGLYETVGRGWYRLGESGDDPEYADFLAYTVMNLMGVVDLLHLANSYKYLHASYVQQAKWPAATLLTLFKSFFTVVLLQQIFASVRRGKLLSETIADFWSPHPPIQERARGSLPQFGPGAVLPLLRSLRPVAVLTAEQREYLPRIIAEVGPAAIPVLVRHLDDASENVRGVAVAALGRLHALEAVRKMVRLRLDPSEWVRQALADALGALGGPNGKRRRSLRQAFHSPSWLGWALRRKKTPAAPPVDPLVLAGAALEGLLADPTSPVRAAAARALGMLGQAAAHAAPALIASTRDGEEAVRIEAAQALGRVGGSTPEAVDALVEMARGDGTPVRVAAAQALGAMKKDAAAAIPALTPLLMDGDEAVRPAVAEAIGKIGTLNGAAVQEMAQGLESADTLVRAQTAEALGTIGTAAAEAAPALAEALTDSNDRVRAKAAQALGQMGEAAAEAAPALVKALRDGDTWVSALAAEALGEMGDGASHAIPALIRSLRHMNPQVRANAAGAIGKLGATAVMAAPALARAARDTEDEVRAQAIYALGEVDGTDPEAERALFAALEDASAKVRAAAVEAVGKRTDLKEKGDAALLRATEDDTDEVKVQAAKALARVAGATPASLAALCKMLREGSTPVRIEAAQALGRLGRDAGAAGEDLLHLTRSGEVSEREQALRAMTVIQPAQAAEAFLAGLKDARPEIRMVASAGLIKAEQATPETAAALIDALHDPESKVRANAACALSRLPELPAEAIAHADDGVRLNAALALRAAPAAKAAPVFRQWLADASARVRLIAAGYLLEADPADADAAAGLVTLLDDPSPRLRRTVVELVDSLGPRAAPFLEALKQRAGAEVDPELSGQLEEVIERLEAVSPAPTDTEG